MAYLKRVIICTVLGVLAGVFCWLGGTQVGIQYTPEMAAATVLNRAFIGFVIGISGWEIPWLLHGAAIGLLGSLPMSVYVSWGLNAMTLFGVAYGVVIEFFATKLLKAPMRASLINTGFLGGLALKLAARGLKGAVKSKIRRK